MDHERILLAETHEGMRAAQKKLFEQEGHTVVADTGTLRGVKQIVDDPTIEFRVAVVSGHLPDVGDGEKAAELIRATRPETIIISNSGVMHQTFGDVNLYKGDPSDLLLEAIKNA